MILLSNMTQLNDLTKLWAFEVECPKRAKRHDHTLRYDTAFLAILTPQLQTSITWWCDWEKSFTKALSLGTENTGLQVAEHADFVEKYSVSTETQSQSLYT